MAYIEIDTSYSAPAAKAGLLAALASMFRTHPTTTMGPRADMAPRKLAGPLPGDHRARGYLDGLDGL